MKLNKIKTTLVLLASGLFIPAQVHAENTGLCGFLPCNVASPCLGTNCEGSSLTLIGSILEILLSLIFVSIIIYGVWLIVQAALKIIRSEGDEAKVEEGFKLIRGSLTGIIMIFVGIIALVVIFAIFNATDIFKIDTGNPPAGITLS